MKNFANTHTHTNARHVHLCLMIGIENEQQRKKNLKFHHHHPLFLIDEHIRKRDVKHVEINELNVNDDDGMMVLAK